MSITLPIAAVAALALAGSLSRRSGSRAVRAPRGMRMASIESGTLVYHGTGVEEEFQMLNGPAWISTSRATAEKFSSWHDEGFRRVYTFNVKKRITGLLNIQSQTDMKLLHEYLESQGLESEDPQEISSAICSLGFNGWHVPDNYGRGESDTMLCEPSRWLELKIMETL